MIQFPPLADGDSEISKVRKQGMKSKRQRHIRISDIGYEKFLDISTPGQVVGCLNSIWERKYLSLILILPLNHRFLLLGDGKRLAMKKSMQVVVKLRFIDRQAVQNLVK